LARLRLPLLGEADDLGALAEALSADVEAVLADQTGLVEADTALARALAVDLWAGVPDVLVSHDEGPKGDARRRAESL